MHVYIYILLFSQYVYNILVITEFWEAEDACNN